MNWTRFSVAKPTAEGWYIVHHAIVALPSDTSYWASMSYKALYWQPDLDLWTENARKPEEGGRIVEIDVLMWAALNCLEEMTKAG